MGEITAGVSWLGVIVGAVGSFVLGYFWYSPKLFGPKWAEGVGLKMVAPDQVPMAALASNFAGLFLMSWFVGATAVRSALFTVILGTLAFTVLAYSGGLFTKKSAYARNTEAGYWLVSLLIMIVSQGIFRRM
jgi:Protein of unknown function (DUF1761)